MHRLGHASACKAAIRSQKLSMVNTMVHCAGSSRARVIATGDVCGG